MSLRTAVPRLLALAAMALVGFWAGRSSRSFPANRPGGSPPTASVASRARLTNPMPAGGTSSKVAADSEVRADFSRRASLPSGSLASDDARQKILEEWAEHDPAGAIEFARKNLTGDRRAQAVSSILAIWGRNDPGGAWAWVGQNEPTATHHYDTLLEVFGKQSPATAARFANELALAHPEATLEINLAALLGIAYTGDFTAARAFVTDNATLTPELRSNLNNFIAGQWARYAPEAAAAWVMSLPAGTQRDQALIGLGESWAGVDPAAAARFATTLPAGEPRQLALRQAITGWLETDADQARHWVLETNQHEDYDQAVAAIATQNNFMFREPDRALQWTGTIFDDALRLRSTATILAGLYSRDPTTTVAYIRGMSNVTNEQRTQLLEQFPPKP